jgi:hypothetical protein
MDDARIRGHLGEIEASLVSAPEDVPALGRLIATLEQHCEVIPGGESTWKPEFEEHWGALEEVYAVALDRGMSALDEECGEIVAEAMAELRKIAATALSNVRARQGV